MHQRLLALPFEGPDTPKARLGLRRQDWEDHLSIPVLGADFLLWDTLSHPFSEKLAISLVLLVAIFLR